jgi:mannose-6-phosphate isomerase-like protein (cupin superfamily)
MKRIITGHDESGKSIFLSKDGPARVVRLENRPGLEFNEMWATDETPNIPVPHEDPTVGMHSFVPSIGGSRFRYLTIPPETDPKSIPNFDARRKLLLEEYAQKVPGIGEHFENEDQRMHTTQTIDYGIVLEGEIWLELDDNEAVQLKQGDCVVQNGTRHAWRNKTDENCLMAFIMIGAEIEKF